MARFVFLRIGEFCQRNDAKRYMIASEQVLWDANHVKKKNTAEGVDESLLCILTGVSDQYLKERALFSE